MRPHPPISGSPDIGISIRKSGKPDLRRRAHFVRAPQDEEKQPFPWDKAIGFGIGVLKLSSAEFWRLTPRELALAMQAVNPRGAVLTRADLTQLMTRHPDGRPVQP
jgi:uncharacterized phage protein (TIGR02216 family)